jgi:hypothetical protein
MVQHKSEKISYKVEKYQYIPEEQQYIVEGMHEAIINKDTFEQVQELMKKRSWPDLCERLLEKLEAAGADTSDERGEFATPLCVGSAILRSTRRAAKNVCNGCTLL